MPIRRNPEFGGVVVGLVLLGGGVLLILLPLLLDMDMMQTGFAMQFGGFFLVVVGLITAVLFGYRVRRLQAILGGSRLLAHWAYEPAQLHDQADKDLQSAQARNWGLLLIVALFFAAFTLLFVVIGIFSGEGDNMPLFVGIMAAILLIVAAFAFGMPYLQRRRALRSSGEAYLAEHGLWLNGALHTWDPPLAALDEVRLLEDGPQARLVFSLRSLSRANATLYQSYSVEVPVPPGQEAAARRVEQYFQEHSPPE
ncbi:MAG: hypothetical protein JXA14_05525 [Anaerolineae bacterium]|nr:hypothetical protein [Anaerolineae bacterium]